MQTKCSANINLPTVASLATGALDGLKDVGTAITCTCLACIDSESVY